MFGNDYDERAKYNERDYREFYDEMEILKYNYAFPDDDKNEMWREKDSIGEEEYRFALIFCYHMRNFIEFLAPISEQEINEFDRGRLDLKQMPATKDLGRMTGFFDNRFVETILRETATYESSSSVDRDEETLNRLNKARTLFMDLDKDTKDKWYGEKDVESKPTTIDEIKQMAKNVEVVISNDGYVMNTSKMLPTVAQQIEDKKTEILKRPIAVTQSEEEDAVRNHKPKQISAKGKETEERLR